MPPSTPVVLTPVTTPYPTDRPPLTKAPPLPSPFGTPMAPTPAQLDAVRNDLTERGVDPAEMQVLSADRVMWSDGSWGCPQPGMGYTQALVEGSRIVVEVAGQSYDYRFGSGDGFRLCTP
ncbi:MAG: hypothetical protein ACK5LN_11995 [Propioniciclava sp.]